MTSLEALFATATDDEIVEAICAALDDGTFEEFVAELDRQLAAHRVH